MRQHLTCLRFMPVLVLPFLFPFTLTSNPLPTMFLWVFALIALLLAATLPRLRAISAFVRARVPVLPIASSSGQSTAVTHVTPPRGRTSGPRRLSGFLNLRRARSLGAVLPRYHPPSTPPPELPLSAIPLVDISEHGHGRGHFRRASEGLPRNSWASLSSLSSASLHSNSSTTPLISTPKQELAASAPTSRAPSPTRSAVINLQPPPPAHRPAHTHGDRNVDSQLIDYDYELVDVSVPPSPAWLQKHSEWTMLVAHPPAEVVTTTPEPILVPKQPIIALQVVEKPASPPPSPSVVQSHLPSPPQSPVLVFRVPVPEPLEIDTRLSEAEADPSLTRTEDDVADDVSSIPDEDEEDGYHTQAPESHRGLEVQRIHMDSPLPGPASAMADIPDEEPQLERALAVEERDEMDSERAEWTEPAMDPEPSVSGYVLDIDIPVETLVDVSETVQDLPQAVVTVNADIPDEAEVRVVDGMPVDELVGELDQPFAEERVVSEQQEEHAAEDVRVQEEGETVPEENMGFNDIYEYHHDSDEHEQQYDLALMPDIPTPVEGGDVSAEDPPVPELPLALALGVVEREEKVEVIPDPEELPLPDLPLPSIPVLRIDTSGSPSPPALDHLDVPERDLASAITEEDVSLPEGALTTGKIADEDAKDSDEESESEAEVDLGVSLLRHRRIPASSEKETDVVPGDFPVDSVPKASQNRAVTSLAAAFARTRSPLDAALAMQLRPGFGVGADGAWLVRFLMSFFGWLGVLVAGGRELEVSRSVH
ncbi:hypothetical protein C8F01DRAFT_1129192 [Mycena amicta]|nr:hypothetical protein C8F01DRAFT_1129192 [Mycena amicta]